MGNNILPVLMIVTALAIGLMVVLASFLKSRKFLYVIPAIIGAPMLLLGIHLFGASSWRNISVGALAIGTAGILVSAFLFVRGIKRAKG